MIYSFRKFRKKANSETKKANSETKKAENPAKEKNTAGETPAKPPKKTVAAAESNSVQRSSVTDHSENRGAQKSKDDKIIKNAGKAGAAEPVLYFSDLISGCNTCVTDDKVRNQGVIVTIWGKNLGSTRGSSKIYIRDPAGQVHEAAHYYYWINADGGKSGGGPANLYESHGMQEVAFAVPSTAGVSTARNPSTIFAVVNGAETNRLDFTVRSSGKAFFVKTKAEGGNDRNRGSWSSPWETLQITSYNTTKVNAGDVVYFCDGVKSSHGARGQWRFKNMKGDADKGRIMYTAYPGADVRVGEAGASGNIGNYNNSSSFIVISKISVITNDSNDHFRNSRFIGIRGTDDTCANGSGGFFTGAGQQSGSKYLGCHITDYGCGKTRNKHHTTYFTVRGNGPIDAWEVGWFYLKDNEARNAIHFYDEYEGGIINGTVEWHDNVIINQTSSAFDIQMGHSEGSPGKVSGTFHIFNNLIVNCGKSNSNGKFNSASIIVSGPSNFANIKFYNNTIYGYSIPKGDDRHDVALEVRGDRKKFAGTWEWINNIVVDTNNRPFVSPELKNKPPAAAHNNIWYNGGDRKPRQVPDWDRSPQTTDPLFINTADFDFRLRHESPGVSSGSPAVGKIVERGLNGNPRGKAAGYDIGAFQN